MVKEGWGVSVVMTKAATEFVTPLTFQTLSRRKVASDMFAPASFSARVRRSSVCSCTSGRAPLSSSSRSSANASML